MTAWPGWLEVPDPCAYPMKGLVLIGGGGHARACIDVIRAEGQHEIAGILDKPELLGTRVLDVPVIGSDEDIPELVKGQSSFLIAVGHLGESGLRASIFGKLLDLKANLPIIVAPSAYVSTHAVIGPGTIIMHMAIVGPGARLGGNVIVNSRALIEHDVIVGENCHVSTGALINGGCVIGRGAFIGSGAVLKQGIIVGENAMLGMGTVIPSNVPPGVRIRSSNIVMEKS